MKRSDVLILLEGVRDELGCIEESLEDAYGVLGHLLEEFKPKTTALTVEQQRAVSRSHTKAGG